MGAIVSLKPPKLGRRASHEERQRAQEIVDLYQEAMARGGVLVVNPEDDRDEQVTFYARPDYLLDQLQTFAKYGTFQAPSELNLPSCLAKQISRRVGGSLEKRAAAVADVLCVSDATAKRLIKK